jgi:hypothetical protein
VIADPIYHYQAVNVEAQLRSPTSLLHWLRQLLRLRGNDPLFSRGEIRFVQASNRRILAFLRQYQGRRALLVHNLSACVQPVRLDLAPLVGWHPQHIGGAHGSSRPGPSHPGAGNGHADPGAARGPGGARGGAGAMPNHGFPSIEATPYFLNLAPYESLWFLLEPPVV